ncbi:hypothetical protein Mal15_14390 [Stieleria maiorica]|uniref:Uncharacterized protein n=1 Tax=Stieleria maiorica TaxID=2795974 RepID=A0A5B9MA39_9BACT|nr:hypothetical protein [Stieleria maiorica]QEF97399.1 hypothetical protein Mal15_14390 [Stieleria maiorica]
MPEHDYEGSRDEFIRMLAEQGEEPAFITRRRRLDAAIEQLRWTCQTHRQTLLRGPQLHLRKIATMIDGDWSRLASRLAVPIQWRVYASLHETINADSQPPAWANQGLWAVPIDRPLRDLARSVDRFNRDWEGYLNRFDLDPINQTIADFNEYYVLEKACALGREDLARLGFQPMSLLTPASLQAEFPTVELPRLR